MKNLLTIAFLIGATALSATAQERRGERPVRSAEEIAAQRTEHMTEKLSLNAEQREAVYALQLQEANRQKELFAARREAAQETRKAREEARKQHMEEQTAMKQQLDDILTAEQRELLAAQRSERYEAMKEMRQKRDGNRGRFERGDRSERSKFRGERRGPRPGRDAELNEKG